MLIYYLFCFYLLYCICAKCKPTWSHQMISQKPNRIWENKYVCTVYVLSTYVFCCVRQIFIPDFEDILFAGFIFFYDLVNQMCCMSPLLEFNNVKTLCGPVLNRSCSNLYFPYIYRYLFSVILFQYQCNLFKVHYPSIFFQWI